jgi:hypothetical protein
MMMTCCISFGLSDRIRGGLDHCKLIKFGGEGMDGGDLDDGDGGSQGRNAVMSLITKSTPSGGC